jgi:hypothetical protein
VTSEGVEVAAVRDAHTIRDQLAVSVDQLADRLAPARLMSEAKASAKAKVTSPAGIAIAGGVTAVLAVIVVRNLRRSRR